MTPGRAAAYIGGAVLLAAWLSAAATSLQEPAPAAVSGPPPAADPDAIRTDVRAQAARLREKLAAAPAPQQPARNPFAFAMRELPRSRQPVHAAAVPEPLPTGAAPGVDVEPQLTLVGMAERQTEAGPARTAVIAGQGDEVFLVTEGQELAGRYRVTTIAADAVELQDVSTGAVRRLVLR